MIRASLRFFTIGVAVAMSPLVLGTLDRAVGHQPGKVDSQKAALPKSREEALGAIFSRAGLAKGAVVADVGAGSGLDSWVFAKLVGETGIVYSEEIGEKDVRSLDANAKKKWLSQVHAVLGKTDDPNLPANSLDLAYMHYVYHHITKPREMLRGLWRALKPGGYLVIVDRNRGTLQEWVPDKDRGPKHFWTSEATVVRQAREEGFAFVACPDDCWNDKQDFVIFLQRPKESKKPGQDPDPLPACSVNENKHLFLPLGRAYQRPVFIALGEARNLMASLLEGSSGKGLDIVLEEWATQKDERPSSPANVGLPSVLTEKGDPHFGPEPIDAVFFLDSFHLLFHGKTLLSKIHGTLSPTGFIYVLDRAPREQLTRREASHCRRIAAQTVEQEMKDAGFSLWFRGPQLSADRFLLVFGKTPADKIKLEDDPFVGGPEITGTPEKWLKQNGWRLRGLKTADGKYTPLLKQEQQLAANLVSTTPSRQTWILPNQEIVLSFENKDGTYSLTHCRSVDKK